jgi:hypothetical protein
VNYSYLSSDVDDAAQSKKGKKLEERVIQQLFDGCISSLNNGIQLDDIKKAAALEIVRANIQSKQMLYFLENETEDAAVRRVNEYINKVCNNIFPP